MSIKYIEAFLEMMIAERGSSPRTIDAYQRDLIDVYTFLSKKNIAMEKATRQNLQEYMQSIANSYYSPKTQSRRLAAIHEFYRFLYSEDKIRKNPSDYIQPPKVGKSLPKYLTEKEIETLIQTSKTLDLRAYVMLELLYASGMRVSELVCLPVQSVTKDNKTITIFGKGSKERIVPLNQEAIKALDKWLLMRELKLKKGRTSKWLFPSFSKEGHLTRDGFFKILKKIATQAQIAQERVSPHVFRHSFASHLIAHKADLRTVQKMLGHADIATTEIYTHILPEHLKKTVENSHPLAYSNFKGK